MPNLCSQKSGHRQRQERNNKIHKPLFSPPQIVDETLRVLMRKGPASEETSLKELEENYTLQPSQSGEWWKRGKCLVYLWMNSGGWTILNQITKEIYMKHGTDLSRADENFALISIDRRQRTQLNIIIGGYHRWQNLLPPPLSYTKTQNESESFTLYKKGQTQFCWQIGVWTPPVPPFTHKITNSAN